MTNLSAKPGNSAAKVQSKESVKPSNVRIGPDILELISTAMYIDPLTVYREYVQNSADAIDDAVEKKLLKPRQGQIEIHVDQSKRSVRLRDNGTGLSKLIFLDRMLALGASSKRGGAHRGFRGVGRLSGLGYARELVFRSSVPDEETSEIVWNAQTLRRLLRSADSSKFSLEQVVEEATEFQTIEGTDDSRFFEVELRGVARLRNDVLLNEDLISAYLSQVAPAPFSEKFSHGEEIEAFLSGRVDMGNLKITVGSTRDPIKRPFQDTLELEDGRSVVLDDLELLELRGSDGGIAAIGWIAHHDYTGAVPSPTLAKGIRLRVGNIQIGNDALLETLFAEPRFNSWSIGEVHIIDSRIVPNARRDDFEQNNHLINLTNQFLPHARSLSKRCRTSSIKRNWQRRFDFSESAVQDHLSVISQGSLPKKDTDALKRKCREAVSEMHRVRDRHEFDDDETSKLNRRIGKTEKRLQEIGELNGAHATALDHLPPTKRKIYRDVFSLIYECSTNRVAAQSLIDRILTQLGPPSAGGRQ